MKYLQLTAVQKIQILKNSKIVLPAFLLLIATIFTGIIFSPHSMPQIKVAGASADNHELHIRILPTPTASPTDISQPAIGAVKADIGSTPSAGASSSINDTDNPSSNSNTSTENTSFVTPTPTIAPVVTNTPSTTGNFAFPTPTTGPVGNGNGAIVSNSITVVNQSAPTTPPPGGTTITTGGTTGNGESSVSNLKSN